MPTPAHSGPDMSHPGRTQKAGPSTSAAFVPAAVAVVVLGRAFQRASATSVPELDVVAASVLEAETGVGAAAGSGPDPKLEFVPIAGEPLPVPGDSTLPSDCPAPDMAARTPSGAEIVGPVALVATEAVLGAEAASGVALPHKTHFDLGRRAGRQWDHLVVVVYTQR